MAKQTPLYQYHKRLNARTTQFCGWDMPLVYSSIIEEHNAVRRKAGLFDTSHMGVFYVSGLKSIEYLNRITVGDIAGLVQGQAKYSLFLNENGGIVDDLIIYKREADFLLVVNAANTQNDFKWLKEHRIEQADVKDISDQVGILALQGPDSEKILQPMLKNDLSALKYFRLIKPQFNDLSPEFSMLARTGYTGEDGFEIVISNDSVPALWDNLISSGVKPCGLGCRDSLRLEACMPLHGHEITEQTTPLEAGLKWAIFWDKDFIGKDALVKQRDEGISKFLTAFILESGIAREKCDIILNSNPVGKVTSGSFSPTLKRGICLGYTNNKLEPGTQVEIIVHGKPRPAKAVKKPFYRRSK